MSWKVKPLGEVFKFQGGTQPSKSKFIFEPKDGYVRLLQIRDFSREDKKVFIPEESSNEAMQCHSHSHSTIGALLLGRICSGSWRSPYTVALKNDYDRYSQD
jgi:hypothetical protein